MEYREIKGVDKKISRIFCGTASDMFINLKAEELLDAVLAMGINAFDSARVYQNSEKMLGKWMADRGNRDQVVILSKCGHPTPLGIKRVNPKEMKKDFATSTKELGTDYIDIYLLHRDDLKVEVGPIVETFNELHAAGKIGAFGGSNWTWQREEAANEYAYAHNLVPFTVSSPNFGLAAQVEDLWGGGCVTISGPENAGARAWYQKHDMPIIAYSSLAHGLFSGKLKSADRKNAAQILDKFAMKGYGYDCNFDRLERVEKLAVEKGATVPQIAMAYIYCQEMDVFAAVSASSPARMEQNMKALEIKLTEKECRYLDEGTAL